MPADILPAFLLEYLSFLAPAVSGMDTPPSPAQNQSLSSRIFLRPAANRQTFPDMRYLLRLFPTLLLQRFDLTDGH